MRPKYLNQICPAPRGWELHGEPVQGEEIYYESLWAQMWPAEDGGWLTDGEDEDTTITIRRPIPTLPTEDGAVIVAADGHEFIEAEAYCATYYAREAMLTDGNWRAAWRTESGGWTPCLSPEYITPGTWKVDDRG